MTPPRSKHFEIPRVSAGDLPPGPYPQPDSRIKMLREHETAGWAISALIGRKVKSPGRTTIWRFINKWNPHAQPSRSLYRQNLTEALFAYLSANEHMWGHNGLWDLLHKVRK